VLAGRKRRVRTASVHLRRRPWRFEGGEQG
jgi:hypothetical protein